MKKLFSRETMKKIFGLKDQGQNMSHRNDLEVEPEFTESEPPYQREPSFEEWADFAGESEEQKWFMKEQNEEIMKEHNCEKFDDLPKEAQDEILGNEQRWAFEWGGNGIKAQELFDKAIVPESFDDNEKDIELDKE